MTWRYYKDRYDIGFNIINEGREYIGEFFDENDAKLASAAPELYEALKDLLSEHNELHEIEAREKALKLLKRLEETDANSKPNS